MNELQWRCFHCDEVFTEIEAAREHFGPNELADPACQINIKKFREMERYLARCLAEDSNSDRDWYAKSVDHARALIAALHNEIEALREVLRLARRSLVWYDDEYNQSRRSPSYMYAAIDAAFEDKPRYPLARPLR